MLVRGSTQKKGKNRGFNKENSEKSSKKEWKRTGNTQLLAGLDMDRIARFKNDKIGSFCSIRSNMKGKKRKQQKTNPFPFFPKNQIDEEGPYSRIQSRNIEGKPWGFRGYILDLYGIISAFWRNTISVLNTKRQKECVWREEDWKGMKLR